MKLGNYVKASSKRNKNGDCSAVYSVTNAQGFVPSVDYFSKEVFSKELRNYKLVDRGMIAYNPSRINVGSVALQDKEDTAIVSPLYVVFSVNQAKLLPEYVVRFLKSDPGLAQIANASIGTVRNNLKYDALCSLEIRIPSVEAQRRRIDHLESIESLILKHRAASNKLDELVKSRFIEMFGDPIENPMTWETKPIGEVYEVGSAKRVYARDQVSEGVPFLRLGDLTDRIQLGIESCDLYVSEELYSEYKNKGLVPDAGDILVTARGTMGLCYIVKEIDKFYFQDGMITWLHAKPESPLPAFLVNLFSNAHFDNDLHLHTSGTTVKYLSIKTLSQLPVIVPPMGLQQEFAAFVWQVDKLRFAVQQSINKLQILYDSLAQEYFGG